MSLVRTLLQNGIYCCGTVKSDSGGFPEELRCPNLRRGETLQMQHDQVIATAWKDKKMVIVYLIMSNKMLKCQKIDGFGC